MPKRNYHFDATPERIREMFELAQSVDEERARARTEAAGFREVCLKSGVDPTVMATIRKIAHMPAGRRGYHALLLAKYLQILGDELRDPSAPEEAPPAGDGADPASDTRPTAVARPRAVRAPARAMSGAVAPWRPYLEPSRLPDSSPPELLAPPALPWEQRA
jgi:hypothetical protein